MKKEAVQYRREKNVGIITLNRPERLNAINPDLLNGLISQLNVAREDEDVVSVILTGAGRSFCAGEDLKETQSGKSLAQWTKEIDALQETQRIILKLGKPLIAAIRGYAVGGGLEFALSCDIRIAAQDVDIFHTVQTERFPDTDVLIIGSQRKAAGVDRIRLADSVGVATREQQVLILIVSARAWVIDSDPNILAGRGLREVFEDDRLSVVDAAEHLD